MVGERVKGWEKGGDERGRGTGRKIKTVQQAINVTDRQTGKKKREMEEQTDSPTTSQKRRE